MTLRRARRPLAMVCIAVVALAVFAPGVAAIDLAPPSPEFVLLPQLDPRPFVTPNVDVVEPSDALHVVLPERAPPYLAAGL